jgi:hypothetical protein
LLRENQNLRKRMRGLERNPESRFMTDPRASDSTSWNEIDSIFDDQGDRNTTRLIPGSSYHQASRLIASESLTIPSRRFKFEDELKASRVYRRAIHNASQRSLDTAVLTVLSVSSLSCISARTIISLPLREEEMSELVAEISPIAFPPPLSLYSEEEQAQRTEEERREEARGYQQQI